MPEAPSHGFVELRAGDRVIAGGEMTQWEGAGRMENRLVFRFADGSVHDDWHAFSQDDGTILRNLGTAPAAKAHMVAFTPQPRVLTLEVRREGEDRFRVGPLERTATRYRIDLEVAGVLGLVAPVIGKAPPDLTYWLVRDGAPAFVRFEGPLFDDGPVWRAEVAALRWTR